MATINRDFFITQFREEVNDHIHRITQRLFQLEEQPGDHEQLVEEILRIAHTLKGSSRMMGYTNVSTLAHKMEDLLVEIRDGHLELHSTVTDLLFYSLDTINYLVEGIAKNVKRTADIEQFTVLFNDVIAGKHVEVPHLQSQLIKPTQQEQTPISLAKPTAMAEQFEEAEEQQYIRIHTGDLDVILNLVGEVIINQHRYEGQRIAYREIIRDLSEHRQKISELQTMLYNQNGGSSGTRLSQFSDGLERSASGMLRKAKTLMKKARTDGQQMHLTMDKLQEKVIDIRMVPASRIFRLFPRLVRMTARRLGKMVELDLSGEKTRIDSRIIEEIRDPLIHLVQNAIHHGIESPEERQSYGKNPTGTITISAHQEGNRIVIKVQDDGQGIHIEQIKNLALKEGLLSHRDMRTVSDQDVLESLFQPGFSTADTVDDIAGRGFGLNIVRAHVDRVQGEIEVRSQANEGTEFVIKLPLTLTIMNALLVRVIDEIFAIPTVAVETTFDISPDDIEHLGKMPVVVFDSALLPVVELQRILQIQPYNGNNGFRSQNFSKDGSRQTVIVIQAEDRRIGFLVDDLIEERKIVIKPLGPCLKRIKNVAGATTVRGDVVIILFVRDLVRSADTILEGSPVRAHFFQKDQALQSDTKSSGSIVPRILLVDDSLNTREVERIILEDAGYEVVTAENGVQAFEMLKKASCDLVVTDIEMPEMDGLQLTKTIKQDELLHDIPVIIVSTKGTREDKKKGLEVGAQAYIVKGEFDEQTLLQTVDSCLK
jgi:two-component system chemotaxis sensor kinase CheA